MIHFENNEANFCKIVLDLNICNWLNLILLESLFQANQFNISIGQNLLNNLSFKINFWIKFTAFNNYRFFQINCSYEKYIVNQRLKTFSIHLQTNPSSRNEYLNALCIRPNGEEVQPKRKAKRCTQQPRTLPGDCVISEAGLCPSRASLSHSLTTFINAGRGQVRRNSIQQAHNCLATKVKLPIAKHKAQRWLREFFSASHPDERERKNSVAHTAAQSGVIYCNNDATQVQQQHDARQIFRNMHMVSSDD